MSRAELIRLFPRLEEAGFDVTSPKDPNYNCIAFAASDQARWWWPVKFFGGFIVGGYYWPPGVPVEETLDSFVAAYASLGYEPCEDGEPEPGFEKVAVYAKSGIPTHAARQVESGAWVSKLGQLEDIEHRAVTGVSGTSYGDVALYLRRPRS